MDKKNSSDSKLPYNPTVIPMTSEQLSQLRQECQNENRLRAMPDLFAKGAGALGNIKALGHYGTALKMGEKLYSFARSQGWHPAGEPEPLCKALAIYDAPKLADVPQLLLTSASPSNQTVSITLPGVSSQPAKSHSQKAKPTTSTALTPRTLKENLRNLSVPEQKLDDVLNQLGKLSTKLDNVEGKVDAVVKWIQEGEQQKESQQLLTEINTGISLLNQLGALTGCRELQHAATIVQAAVNIGVSVGQLTAGFSLGPVVGVISAVFSIFSLFMSNGPNPTQLILDQINKLSDQISSLHVDMAKHFQANLRMQYEILSAIHYGFGQLTQHIDQQIHGLRTDFKIDFHDLNVRLKFLSHRQRFTDINTYLVPLQAASANVTHYLQGVYPDNVVADVRAQTQQLILGIENAANPVLNGLVFYKALQASSSPIDDLLEELGSLNEAGMDYYLGFFAAYAHDKIKMDGTLKEVQVLINHQPVQSLISPLDPKTIPNPEIWLKAIEDYISLMSLFPQLDPDTENVLLENFIAMGQQGLDFFARLSADHVFWKNLLVLYENALKEVADKALEVAREYSDNELQRLNQPYQHKSQTSQVGLTQAQFDILASPLQLITAFQKRQINHIDPNTIVNRQGMKLSNSTPLCYAIEDHPHYEIILTGEFLQKLSFSAIQETDIPQPYIASEVYGNWECNRLNGIICSISKTVKGRLPRDRRSEGDIIDATVDWNFFKDPNDHSVIQRSWIFPLTLEVVVDGTKHKIHTFDFLGSYDGLSVEAKILDVTGEHGGQELILPAGVQLGSKEYFRLTEDPNARQVPGLVSVTHWSDKNGDSVFYRQKLIREIPNHVEKKWNEPKAAFNRAASKSVKDISSDVMSVINQYYFDQRTQLVRKMKQVLSSTPSGKLYAYRQALRQLDVTVGLIRFYAYLMGKDTHAQVLKDLVTSEVVDKDLDRYAQDKTLQAVWLECISNALKTKLSSKTIMSLPVANLAPLAARIFIDGQAKLRMYRTWKLLYKSRFPNFSQYVDVKKYLQMREQIRQYQFMRRVLTSFKELQRKDFDKARSLIEKQDVLSVNPMDKKMYHESNHDIYYWAMDESVKLINTAYIEDIEQAIERGDETQLQEMVAMYLKPSRWSFNLASLMKFAAKHGNCKFPAGLQAVNFLIWLEGAHTFLDTIVFNKNEKVRAAALEDGNTNAVKLKAVKNIEKRGQELKTVLSAIGQSKQLFEYLFSTYLKILQEPLDFIKYRLSNAYASGSSQLQTDLGSKPPKAIDVYKLLATNAYSGARDKLFDRLCMYAIITLSYLEMSFGYHFLPAENAAHQFYFGENLFTLFSDRDDLLEYLKQMNDAGKLETALEEYIEQVKRLEHTILLQIEYVQDLHAFNRYLETFDRLPSPGAVLEISNRVMSFPLMQGKIELIGKFLQSHRYITEIVIANLELNDTTLKALLEVLARCPWLQTIVFSNCNLTRTSLQLLGQYLSLVTNLESLRMSNNILNKKDNVELLFQLSDLIHQLPLVNLNLSNTQLDEYGVGAVILAAGANSKFRRLDLSSNSVTIAQCKDMPQRLPHLTWLNLSGNPLVQANNAEHLLQLMNFVSDFTSLTQLNLADCQLNEEAIAAVLVGALEHPCLSVIDLSGNKITAFEKIQPSLLALQQRTTPKVRILFADTGVERDKIPSELREMLIFITEITHEPVAPKLLPIEEQQLVPLNDHLGQPLLDQMLHGLNLTADQLSSEAEEHMVLADTRQSPLTWSYRGGRLTYQPHMFRSLSSTPGTTSLAANQLEGTKP